MEKMNERHNTEDNVERSTDVKGMDCIHHEKAKKNKGTMTPVFHEDFLYKQSH
jgi:hypothetical protein